MMSKKSGWIRLERDRDTGELSNPFPAVCCTCLKPTQSKYRMLARRMRTRYGPTFCIPLCTSCQAALDRRRNRTGAAVIVLILLSGAICFAVFRTGTSRLVSIVAVTGLLSVFGVVFSQFLIEPFQCLGTRIRFRNAQFSRLWRETWGKPIEFIHLPLEE